MHDKWSGWQCHKIVRFNKNSHMKTEILSAREAKMVSNIKKESGLLAIVNKDFLLALPWSKGKKPCPVSVLNFCNFSWCMSPSHFSHSFVLSYKWLVASSGFLYWSLQWLAQKWFVEVYLIFKIIFFCYIIAHKYVSKLQTFIIRISTKQTDQFVKFPGTAVSMLWRHIKYFNRNIFKINQFEQTKGFNYIKKTFHRNRNRRRKSFSLVSGKLYRPGALDISFHVIFLRTLVSLNVFVISSVIRIWRSVRFPRVPRKKICFHVISLRLKILIIDWYIVAGQKNAKTDENFWVLDQSDPFKAD